VDLPDFLVGRESIVNTNSTLTIISRFWQSNGIIFSRYWGVSKRFSEDTCYTLLQ